MYMVKINRFTTEGLQRKYSSWATTTSYDTILTDNEITTADIETKHTNTHTASIHVIL